LSENNSDWFDLVATTIAIDVEAHEGALKVEKHVYRQILIGLEPRLAGCPEVVWEHYRLAFAKYGLHACCFNPGELSDKVLLIHYTWMDEDSARQIVAKYEAASPERLAMST